MLLNVIQTFIKKTHSSRLLLKELLDLYVNSALCLQTTSGTVFLIRFHSFPSENLSLTFP